MGRFVQRPCIAFLVVCALGAAVIVGGQGLAVAADPPAPAPTGAVAASTANGGVSAQAVVGPVFYSFIDTTRKATCEAIGPVDRPIQALVWYDPTLQLPGRPLPVLIFAHGAGGGGLPGFIAQAPLYAARGYFVVVPFFPMSGLVPPFNYYTMPTPGPVPPICNLDIPNQAGDVSFVLTQLTSKLGSLEPGGLPAGLFDPNRTGLRGESGGAITGLLFFNPCCTDARIIAVLSDRGTPIMGGPGSVWPEFGPTLPYDFTRKIALFMLSGCFDTSMDIAAGGPGQGFPRAFGGWSATGPPKYFLADTNPAFVHEIPFPLPAAAAAAPDAFFDRYLLGVTTQATLDALLGDAGSPDYRYATEVPGAPTNTAAIACSAPGVGAPATATSSAGAAAAVAARPILVVPRFTG